MGECVGKAQTLGCVLEGTNWEIFEAIQKLTDARKSKADEIRKTVEEALRSDEHVRELEARPERGAVEGGAVADGDASGR